MFLLFCKLFFPAQNGKSSLESIEAEVIWPLFPFFLTSLFNKQQEIQIKFVYSQTYSRNKDGLKLFFFQAFKKTNHKEFSGISNV